MKRGLWIGLACSTALIAALACSLITPAPATVSSYAPSVTAAVPTMGPTSPPASATAAPTSSPLPSGEGPCMAGSAGGIDTYNRPSYAADIFSTVSLTPPVAVGSRSADGWLGFDPAKAQAANIGVFRLRWIPPDAAISLSGNCAGVPSADWVPEPGVCYEMVMETVDVHAAADPTSAVSATLNVEDFAAILGRTATGWLFINGDQANTPGALGYIPEAQANVNGPCDSVPMLP